MVARTVTDGGGDEDNEGASITGAGRDVSALNGRLGAMGYAGSTEPPCGLELLADILSLKRA